MQSVYVINLPQRTDRRRETEKQLARIGWLAEFFPAIRPPDAGEFPSLGARGCFLSHLAVLKLAERKKTKQLVILEDDVDFYEGFADGWHSAESALAGRPWSLFYPGPHIPNLPPGLTKMPSGTGIMTTHFMVFNGDAIPLLIRELETIMSRTPGDPLGGPMHIDGAYSTIRRQHPRLDTYVHFPPLGHQRSSHSDVANRGWLDQVAPIRRALDLGRKMKRHFRARR